MSLFVQYKISSDRFVAARIIATTLLEENKGREKLQILERILQNGIVLDFN